MKVKALVTFYDLQLKRVISDGEVYDVSEARAKELSSYDNLSRQPLVTIISAPTTTTKGRGRAKKEAKE